MFAITTPILYTRLIEATPGSCSCASAGNGPPDMADPAASHLNEFEKLSDVQLIELLAQEAQALLLSDQNGEAEPFR